MGEITRVKTLSEAFSMVRERRPFVYYHSPAARFLYHPKDADSAIFLIAIANDALSIENCSPIAAEMGVFLKEKPVHNIALGEWRCYGFELERHELKLK